MPDLTQAAVAGLFALLGGFAGAALTRRTEYEKWLRQERTKAFAEYIAQLYETRLLATRTYYDEPGTELEKSIKVTEAFTRLGRYTATARLFMSPSGRKALTLSQNSLWIDCTVQGGPANRVNQIKAHMKQIQEVLEVELEALPGIFRWPFTRKNQE